MKEEKVHLENLNKQLIAKVEDFKNFKEEKVQLEKI